MDQWDEKDAADGQSGVIDCRSIVQEVDSKAQFSLISFPGSEPNVELDESHKHIKGDYRVIESFAPLGPVQRVIGI